MAKKTEDTLTNSLTVTPVAFAALETMPEDLKRDAGLGTEAIGTEDVKPARLKLCQSGTPQRKMDDPKQIKGLQELDLFNDLSGEIYGRTVDVVVIKMLGHKNVLFDPFKLGTVLEFSLPDDDPRCQWPTDETGRSLRDEKGKRLKPAATKFYDYLLWIPSTAEIVTFSLASTQIKAAIKLNGMLKLPIRIGGQIITRPPAWARTFKLSTFMQKDGELSWGMLNVEIGGATDEATRELCSSLYSDYSTRKVQVEYGADDATVAEAYVDADGADRVSADM